MSWQARGDVLIEGYASPFGVADLAGDVVRAGAFARSPRSGLPAMLFQHLGARLAGRWTTMREDGRGLFVRGLVMAAGRSVVEMIGLRRLDELSVRLHCARLAPARRRRPRPARVGSA
jgi:HK97 family phage prohead protease